MLLDFVTENLNRYYKLVLSWRLLNDDNKDRILASTPWKLLIAEKVESIHGSTAIAITETWVALRVAICPLIFLMLDKVVTWWDCGGAVIGGNWIPVLCYVAEIKKGLPQLAVSPDLLSPSLSSPPSASRLGRPLGSMSLQYLSLISRQPPHLIVCVSLGACFSLSSIVERDCGHLMRL